MTNSADKIRLRLKANAAPHSKGTSTDDIIEAVGQVIDELRDELKELEYRLGSIEHRISKLEYKDAHE